MTTEARAFFHKQQSARLQDRGWTVDRAPGQVTVWSCVIQGVLCRWWGEIPPPDQFPSRGQLPTREEIAALLPRISIYNATTQRWELQEDMITAARVIARLAEGRKG